MRSVPVSGNRERAYQVTSRQDISTPVVGLAQGKVWLTENVEA